MSVIIRFKRHTSSDLSQMRSGPEKDAKARLILDNLAEQTGVKFVPEERPLPTWVVELAP
jgi:hypothetical protein